jgi:hypothetical protein
MRIPRGRYALLAAPLILGASLAHAACTSRRCTDQAAVGNVRNRIAANCDCQGSPSGAAYRRCARRVIEAALSDGSLPEACRATVARCEAKTTCGRRGAVVCCQRGGKGRIVAGADRCGGTSCAGLRSTADGCTDEGACVPLAAPFRDIQTVLAGSCALPTCHSPVARQGGLSLESEDISYQSLVDRPPTDPTAQTMGLLRVAPGDPARSFLLRKLRGEGPGTAMPQNAPPLPQSIVAMVEAWIARGAHTTAAECSTDPAERPQGTGVLAGCDAPPATGGYRWKPQKRLKPPKRTRGVGLYVPKRDVAPGEEWETCYAFRPDWKKIAKAMRLPEGQLPTIRRQDYRMHDGSHHLLVYAYFGRFPEAWPEGFFPCFAANCINPGDCPPDSDNLTIPIGGTQVAGTRYAIQYPPGVGVPVLGENMVIIANLHYTNPFQPPQPVHAEAWLNFHFAKPDEFQVLLDGIFAINSRDLFVEPYETKTISRIWRPRGLLGRQPVDAAIFQLFGHMHKRGERFQIDFVRDGACSASGALCGRDADCACRPTDDDCVAGQTCVRGPAAEDTTIYYTESWDHAPVLDYSAPYLRVKKEEGLRWTCTHTNGYRDDPNRPPKLCHDGCNACGWDAATRTCRFERGVTLGAHSEVRVYQEGEPMPLVFGELAGDDMCNMFGYFIPAAEADRLAAEAAAKRRRR